MDNFPLNLGINIATEPLTKTPLGFFAPYIDREDVYLTPNMTYYPRVAKKPKGVLVNGSVAILIPKFKGKLSKQQMIYFSTDEYRKFYQIARNYQTRSLNVDGCSVFFYGLLKKNPGHER